MREKMIRNQSATHCRTLYRNTDDTYTVFVEVFSSDLKHVEFDYELNYGMFGEALEAVNYKRD